MRVDRNNGWLKIIYARFFDGRPKGYLFLFVSSLTIWNPPNNHGPKVAYDICKINCCNVCSCSPAYLSFCCILNISLPPSSEVTWPELIAFCTQVLDSFAWFIASLTLWEFVARALVFFVLKFSVLFFTSYVWEWVLEAQRTHVIEVGISIHFSALDAKFGFYYRFFVVFLSHRRVYN